MLKTLYGSSLALLTDLYQLTMAYGYWKSGMAERQAVFHLFYRKEPFDGGYALAAGLETAMEYLDSFRFHASDLEYVATLTGNDGKPLFEPAFIRYLSTLAFTCDVDAIREGTVVFGYEPLLRVTGPILQAQLIETPLLNLVNFQTLVATKAARVCSAAQGEPVIEFGLRRAQGPDGGLSAARAAYIGGSAGTSNLLAGKLLGIPVLGTHAHSWVMSFPDELSAFAAYAQSLPNNCVFLVDTYDTLEGVRRAIEVGKELRANGHEMAGIRLDSGDLAYLSIEARKLLDEAGFPKASIVASNDLDEHLIRSLKDQGATITVWGVGTKLVTGNEQPALGGVYKLTAIRDAAGDWQYKIKLSEQRAKITNPGILQVRRFLRAGSFQADMLYDQAYGVSEPPVIHDIDDITLVRTIDAYDESMDLLEPVFRQGARVYDSPGLPAIQAYARSQLDKLDMRTQRFLNPQTYALGLEPRLHQRKLELIAQARAHSGLSNPNAVSGEDTP